MVLSCGKKSLNSFGLNWQQLPLKPIAISIKGLSLCITQEAKRIFIKPQKIENELSP